MLAARQPGGGGPPALLVHGFLTGAVYWDPNLPALAEVCRPVVIDLWGHDASPSPTGDGPYRPVGLVAAIEALRVSLDIDDWFVIGHSLGAAIAVRYALAHPERVRALVVTNSNSAFAPPAKEARRQEASRKLAARVADKGMAAFDGHPLNPHGSKRLPPDVRAALVDAFARHDPVGLAGTLRWTTPNVAAVDRLGELRPPTLLTWGTYERRFAEGAAIAKAAMPNLEVATLAGGHPVNVQDRAGFDRAVTEFLARHR